MKIVLFLICLHISVYAQARSAKEVKESKKIVLATEGAFAPFNYFKKDQLSGFEVDLANAIAKELGLEVEWKTYNFDSLLIGLKQGKYDAVIASHGITEARKKAVDFTQPHYCSGGVIVSKIEGGPKTVKDLKGKTVAVQVGTTYLQKLQDLDTKMQIKTYPKDTDAFQNLISGRADAVVTDRFLALNAMKVHKDKIDLRVGDYLFVEKIAMAVKKKNDSLKEFLNKGLNKVLENGAYKKISKKYFGEDIRCKG